ncbi:hypothetical protein MAR_036025 [Mya arenaria]|uniref:Uncharacterized protein n=1 Tax=Mya arenaria TaxID=6604 RepID=A0ABY7EPB9_MYAAR|nr:hypothetical protein MAR_036025 [Mya arenaria]
MKKYNKKTHTNISRTILCLFVLVSRRCFLNIPAKDQCIFNFLKYSYFLAAVGNILILYII